MKKEKEKGYLHLYYKEEEKKKTKEGHLHLLQRKKKIIH